MFHSLWGGGSPGDSLTNEVSVHCFLFSFSGRDIQDSALCMINPEKALAHAFETSTFLFFLAPMTAITVLYGLIGLAIRR